MHADIEAPKNYIENYDYMNNEDMAVFAGRLSLDILFINSSHLSRVQYGPV